MKIGVLVKQVPDTESRILPSDDGQGIKEDGLKFVPNPYDEFAIEQALLTKEAAGGEVVVVGLGPARSQDALRTALAMGADRAILLDNQAFLGGDVQSVAHALAAVCKSEAFELVFAGRQAVDGDESQVPQLLGEILGWPSITAVHSFELSGDGATARRFVDAGEEEVWQSSLPLIVSADKGLNEPRYASLPGIMKAKKKPMDHPSPDDLEVDVATLGEAGSGSKVSGLSEPPPRPPGRILEGDDLGAQVHELVRLLREEAKVI